MPRQNQHNYFTYINTNKRQTVLYVGVTNSLERRIWEHKHKTVNSFTNSIQSFTTPVVNGILY